MTTIAVTGGTGTRVRRVTDRLRAGAHGVRILSRHAQPCAAGPCDGPGDAGYRRGGHLTPERAVGKAAFEEFLAQRFQRRPG
ncbi:hypothetical protein ABZS81_23735 [Streptomyces sp. NPDC005318]|uniref:hypothetical protein n=1 Tax=Streptomyces sp. NPDC005318 TaxID=3157031 RepID=UPI0033AA713D